MKDYVGTFLTIVLLNVAGWATNAISGSALLAESIARVESAYRSLPVTLAAYNAAVREICEEMQSTGVSEFKSRLKNLDVSFESPNVGLPLRHVEVSPSPATVGPVEAGIPMVVGYDTRQAPLYPPEGLFVDATAIYDRPAGHPRFSIRYATTDVMLKGSTYRLAINPTGAGDHLKLRAKAFAKSGFEGMIRPSSMLRKPQVYLLDPYDPNKIPILMVHGLQSTPVAFAALVNALRNDPEIRAKYQIWQFYYASGTAVLANAAELRDSLVQTVHTLDPKDRNAATKRIVVLAHSMGGVISHTLVSSSEGRVWATVFRIPPVRLKGDRRPSAKAYMFYIFGGTLESRVSFLWPLHTAVARWWIPLLGGWAIRSLAYRRCRSADSANLHA
jgi:hypothetical protein